MTASLKKSGPGLKASLVGAMMLQKEVQGRKVVIGVLGETEMLHEEIDTVALAVIHEFGTDRIPSRSFLRSTFDTQKERWFKLGTRLLKQVLRGRLEVDDVLALLGERAKADIKHTIVAGIPPPLAASTIAKRLAEKGQNRTRRALANATSPKAMLRALRAANNRRGQMRMAAAVFGTDGGSSSFKPLIDSGRLLGSIDYEVR